MKKTITFFATLFITVAAFAQSGSMDTSFNPTDAGFGNGDGANSTVNSLAVQPDGKILIGGSFSIYNGTTRNRIARLNADSSLDTDFNPGTGANSTINSLAMQPDGKILIGGIFTTYNGTARNRIARLNADGSLDAGFNPGTGANQQIQSLAIQPDGKILIGGFFTSYNGTARSRIARLNANGSLDTSFDIGSGPNGTINSLAMQPDGKILIGGLFSNYNGTARSHIARLNADGSLDTGFTGSGADNNITSLAMQPDGKILIGGAFSTYNGTARSRIARLNADGSLDTGFNPGTGANQQIQSLAMQPDGKILIGGFFTSYNDISRTQIARLNDDGSLDTGFNPGTGANSAIRSLAIQPDGKILIGGGFRFYNGTPRNYIARLNADGNLDTDFNPGTGANSTINSVVMQPDGKILIAGAFTSYNGTTRNRIARLNADGSLDTSFNPGTGANSAIQSLALQPDGKILIGGFFSSYNGTTKDYIVRLNADGSLDTDFNAAGTGADDYIYSIAIQPDGKILIGGYLYSYNGTERNRIARLNADGSLDTSFDPGNGANSGVNSLAIQPDGKILIGGDFNSYNGTERNYIARLNADGSLDTDFNPSSGASSSIFSLAIQPDGKILIGGAFSFYNWTARNNIARLNANGSLDTDFDPGTGANGDIYSLAMQPDGKILIGGFFTSYNGTARNRIARLNANGSLDTDFDPGTGASDGAVSLGIQPDGKILIGGFFTSYDGVGRNRITRVNVGIAATSPPTAEAQTLCQGSTVANLVATGTDLKWYDVSTAGAELDDSTLLTSTTYYVSQTISGDESERTAVAVTVNANVTYYADVDVDGFGDATAPIESCTGQPIGYSLDNTDCDDAVFAINPVATEICWNNIDDNCDAVKSEGCIAIPVYVNNPTPVSGLGVGTISNFATSLSAVPYSYAGATSLDYRYEVTNISVTPNQTVTFTQTGALARYFTIPIAIRGFDTDYTIRASAVINGEEVPYVVPVITVRSTGIPTINMTDASCGTVLSRLNATISANPGFNASLYKFRIRLTSDTAQSPMYYYVESPSRFIGANSFVGLSLQYGTSYSVSVQYTTASAGATATAVTSDYGDECIIVTPSIPLIGLSSFSCGSTLDRLGATISANPAVDAVQYQFRVRLTSDNGVPPTYYTTIASESRFSSLTAAQGLVVANGTQYSVSVRYSISLNGAAPSFTEYGLECVITTPAAAPVPRIQTAPFNVVAYPNPFSEGFQLNVTTANAGIVSIKTYDMIGRLIEERSSKVSELENTTIGANYPSGVYNVIVSQEDEIRTVRVVKR